MDSRKGSPRPHNTGQKHSFGVKRLWWLWLWLWWFRRLRVRRVCPGSQTPRDRSRASAPADSRPDDGAQGLYLCDGVTHGSEHVSTKPWRARAQSLPTQTYPHTNARVPQMRAGRAPMGSRTSTNTRAQTTKSVTQSLHK